MPRSGGRLPKRSSERRRRNAVPGETVVQRDEAVKIPVLPGPKTEAGATIHPIARRWYNALKQSGQSEFFEPSDWAAALYVVEAMSLNLNQGKRFSSVLFSSVWSAMEALLTTEAARRRARLEVERGIIEEGEKPTSIEDRRKAISG